MKMGHTSRVRGRSARRSWTQVGLAALVAAGASACSLGFDTFDPVAGQDGSSTDTAAPGEGGMTLDSGVDATGGDDSSIEGDTSAPQDSSAPESGPVEAGCPGQ